MTQFSNAPSGATDKLVLISDRAVLALREMLELPSTMPDATVAAVARIGVIGGRVGAVAHVLAAYDMARQALVGFDDEDVPYGQDYESRALANLDEIERKRGYR